MDSFTVDTIFDPQKEAIYIPSFINLLIWFYDFFIFQKIAFHSPFAFC